MVRRGAELGASGLCRRRGLSLALQPPDAWK